MGWQPGNDTSRDSFSESLNMMFNSSQHTGQHTQLEGNYSAACRIRGKTIKICKMQNVLPYKEIHFAFCRKYYHIRQYILHFAEGITI